MQLTLDIYTFLAACKKHNIPVINIDPDDLEADLTRFKQKHSAKLTEIEG